MHSSFLLFRRLSSPFQIVRPFRDVSLTAPMCSTLGGMALNAAPDLELYSKTLPEPGMHNGMFFGAAFAGPSLFGFVGYT